MRSHGAHWANDQQRKKKCGHTNQLRPKKKLK